MLSDCWAIKTFLPSRTRLIQNCQSHPRTEKCRGLGPTHSGEIKYTLSELSRKDRHHSMLRLRLLFRRIKQDFLLEWPFNKSRSAAKSSALEERHCMHGLV